MRYSIELAMKVIVISEPERLGNKTKFSRPPELKAEEE
jgi:hypothetical protein